MKKKVEKSHKLLRNLKSQGLSLNTIIVAAIVLIVLIVLWAIFTGRMGGFALGLKQTGKCIDVCKTAAYESWDDETQKICNEKTTDNRWAGKSYTGALGQDLTKGCCCFNGAGGKSTGIIEPAR